VGKNVAKNAVFNTAYNMLNVVFPLLSSIYVSRVLAPEGVGIVADARNTASYFLMFAMLGIPAYGMRMIAQLRDDKSRQDQAFSELLAINFFSTVISALVYFIAVYFLFPDERFLYFVFGFEILFNIINIDWYYQGQEEYGYIAVRSIIVKVISLLALFLFVKDRQDYVIYAIILCVGVGANYIFNVLYAMRQVKVQCKGLHLREHMRPIITLMLGTVSATLYSRVDITMLGIFTDSASIGYYTNAQKIIQLIITLSISLSAVFLPRLSYAYKNDEKQFQHYVDVGLKLILLLVIPICVGVLIVSDNLVDVLYGYAFAPAIPTMRILSVLALIKGVGDLLCYQVLLSAGREKKFIMAHIIAGVLNIALNAILIPIWGHNGAAIASVAAELVNNGVLLFVSLRIIKPKINWRFLLSIMSSTAIMAIAATWMRCVFSQSICQLIFSVVVGVVVYAISLRLTGNELLADMINKILKRHKRER
jgi:O-antigen/teichoic acid export membrane protein